MNNWAERLNTKVRAFNKVNRRANELQPVLLAMFRPYVGKKVMTHGGLVAKLNAQFGALAEREEFQLFRELSDYRLTFTLKAWEPYHGEGVHGGSYAEAPIYVGDFGTGAEGYHLANVTAEPLALRTDYNAEEVRELRKAADAAQDAARKAENALWPFGKYDN